MSIRFPGQNSTSPSAMTSERACKKRKEDDTRAIRKVRELQLEQLLAKQNTQNSFTYEDCFDEKRFVSKMQVSLQKWKSEAFFVFSSLNPFLEVLWMDAFENWIPKDKESVFKDLHTIFASLKELSESKEKLSVTQVKINNALQKCFEKVILNLDPFKQYITPDSWEDISKVFLALFPNFDFSSRLAKNMYQLLGQLSPDQSSEFLTLNAVKTFFECVFKDKISEDVLTWSEELKKAENPFLPELQKLITVLYVTKKTEPGNAISLLIEILDKNPANLFALRCKGKALLDSRDPKEAFHIFNEAMARFPKDYLTYIYRGMCLEKMNNLDEAILDYTTALNMEDHDLFDLFLRGRCFFNRGKYKDASADFTTLLKEKKDILVIKLRGECYFYLGEFEKAKEDLQTFIDSDPKNSNDEMKKIRELVNLCDIQLKITELSLHESKV